mgnify:CR=1 FL=1
MKLILAPMRGLTDQVFRRVYTDFFGGLDLVVAPFISMMDKNPPPREDFTDLEPKSEGKIPVVPQLLGNHAGALVNYARLLKAQGFGEVNWNLACPHGVVSERKKGAGLLPFPDRIAAILDHYFEDPVLSLSLKVRLGHQDERELLRLLPLFSRYPLVSLTVHPRIAADGYSGALRLSMLEEILDSTSLPVIYSGEIKTAGDFHALKARFPGIKSWMLGRGLLADPFLPEKIRGKIGEREGSRQLVKEFLLILAQDYSRAFRNEGNALARIKALWCYLGDFFHPEAQLCRKISKARHLEEFFERME